MKRDSSPISADIAVKQTIIDAVHRAGINKSEFARLIGKDEKEARRILDPNYTSKLITLERALHKLGWKLIIRAVKLKD